jgi:hypothetical protein
LGETASQFSEISGMSAIVEMVRAAAAPKGRDRFSCPLPVWDFLWELGLTFGWQPQGTTYVLPARSMVESPARRDYHPGGTRDYKQVDEADAMAWARALELAKASPHLPAMIEARSLALADGDKIVSDLLPGLLEEFIEFAYGGAFTFAILSARAS